MEIDLLKTFQRVATLGSITKAADDLYLSVSTVTGRIKALEVELGKELFHRTGRRIELTDEGFQFLNYVDRFISILQEGQKKIKLSRDTHTGELSIAVTPIVASYLLPKLIRSFRMKYSQIHLRIVACPNYQVIDKVNSGQAELGIVHHFVDEGGLTSRKWFNDDLIVVLPAGHPLTERPFLQPEHLKGYPILGFPNHLQQWEAVQQWFNDADVVPNVIMELGHVETLKRLLIEFEAISFLPRISVIEEIEKGLLKTVPLTPSIHIKWEMEFVYRHNLQLSLAVNTFLDFASHYIEESQGIK
jgi:DNA-binding transcriptional LysR family regulator